MFWLWCVEVRRGWGWGERGEVREGDLKGEEKNNLNNNSHYN